LDILFKFFYFTQCASAKAPKIKIHLNKKLINEKPFKDMSHYNIIN
jgi:hypothetical protein